jgi:hypothetical protein
MKKPEEIEKQIELLRLELEESRKFHEYKLLCNDTYSNEMIGFFNIGKAKKILTALNDGEHLQFRHALYGDINMHMNQQKNRIMLEDNKNIIEENIMNFIIWGSGDWYIKKY